MNRRGTVPFADHMSRAALREELKERLEKAAWAAAPGSLEFVACPRTRLRDLDDHALRGLLDAQPGMPVECADLDAFLARAAPHAPVHALRRLRRILRANLVDLKVVAVGGRALVIGAAPMGGIVGLAAHAATCARPGRWPWYAGLRLSRRATLPPAKP
ncbi:MAG TPA: hypothetical protein VK929_01550 [Longimicrobiales bacterium]|nr:hypothetical protein [Longimicrobiales bacterium]